MVKLITLTPRDGGAGIGHNFALKAQRGVLKTQGRSVGLLRALGPSRNAHGAVPMT